MYLSAVRAKTLLRELLFVTCYGANFFPCFIRRFLVLSSCLIFFSPSGCKGSFIGGFCLGFGLMLFFLFTYFFFGEATLMDVIFPVHLISIVIFGHGSRELVAAGSLSLVQFTYGRGIQVFFLEGDVYECKIF